MSRADIGRSGQASKRLMWVKIASGRQSSQRRVPRQCVIKKLQSPRGHAKRMAPREQLTTTTNIIGTSLREGAAWLQCRGSIGSGDAESPITKPIAMWPLRVPVTRCGSCRSEGGNARRPSWSDVKRRAWHRRPRAAKSASTCISLRGARIAIVSGATHAAYCRGPGAWKRVDTSSAVRSPRDACPPTPRHKRHG